MEGNELIRMRQRTSDYKNKLNVSLEEGRKDVEVENLHIEVTFVKSRDIE